MADALDRLKARLADHHAFGALLYLLQWDQRTMMPPAGAEHRADHLALLERVRHERFTDPETYQRVKGVYRMDARAMGLMRKYGILLHPLPRVDEIAPEVDADPRSAYFRQARNGLHIRMALLDRLLT